MKHCPNCVTQLQVNKKKLGKFKLWLICPSCGFRTRPDSDISTPSIIKNVKINNNQIPDEANGRYDR